MLTFHIIWTLLLLLIFVGIFIWAFDRRRRTDFEAAAQLPLEPDNYDQIPAPVVDINSRRNSAPNIKSGGKTHE
ncbi:MAG: CcoQ/FixQ family Cbb3-type cytochrome c oxidase assembly chaperone [Granulosicoccus sp.]|nr:CcoQ/FixQ family Cbb3-type cytochrome c oxidase assembly chaperone [Granulosicoccus sp.]